MSRIVILLLFICSFAVAQNRQCINSNYDNPWHTSTNGVPEKLDIVSFDTNCSGEGRAAEWFSGKKYYTGTLEDRPSPSERYFHWEQILEDYAGDPSKKIPGVIEEVSQLVNSPNPYPRSQWGPTSWNTPSFTTQNGPDTLGMGPIV